jgi:acyl-CoA synthetase (AMP-forming)/AMP-acid ligase II
MNIGRWLRDRARTTPGRTAIVSGAVRVTYGELDERSEQLAVGRSPQDRSPVTAWPR